MLESCRCFVHSVWFVLKHTTMSNHFGVHKKTLSARLRARVALGHLVVWSAPWVLMAVTALCRASNKSVETMHRKLCNKTGKVCANVSSTSRHEISNNKGIDQIIAMLKPDAKVIRTRITCDTCRAGGCIVHTVHTDTCTVYIQPFIYM